MNVKKPAEQPWNVPVAVADIPETGRRIELAPDAATLAEIALAVGVAALPRLEMAAELTRYGDDGLRVDGRVVATVRQNCVVTLDPIESEIDEPIDLLFVSAPAAGAAQKAKSVAAEDPPEPLQDGKIDLGLVAIEHLILGIDPYPRKPGAVFEPPPAGEPDTHPFAALAVLKKDKG